MTDDPLRTGPRPPVEPAGAGRPEPQVDPRAPMPPKALLAALVGMLAGNAGAGIGYAVGLAIDPNGQAVALLLGQVLLWGGMIGACWWASRRYGTGRPTADFAIRSRPVDVAWGLLFAAVDWAAAATVAQLVSLLGKDYAGNNSSIVTDVKHDVPALVVTIAFALVGAPIVEELFFRGLVQRALEPWAGVVVAVVVQGLLFGAVHVFEGSGAGRLGLWLSLSAVGIVHGVVYQRFKRLPVAMWTHALFNATGVVLIFTALLRG